MSSKVAHYLQQHVMGEVMTGKDILEYFSTDASIFQKKPSVVVYPRNTSDVRKVARFTWQLAERNGKSVPITARGKGTDLGGAAIGEGVILVFPAHMNKILELDRDRVKVQPGIIYSKLEQTLHTHGRFLPPYPSSLEFATIGGAVGNNACGERTPKYGDTRKYVKGLSVVLANGELIKTHRLTKRELNKKKGLTSFEGEIYRSLDNLITENQDLMPQLTKNVTKNAAGYGLQHVKNKDGTFDLTPLFVGSQGTLGIITQIELATASYNPNTSLIAAFFDDINKATEATEKLNALKPSTIELVDNNLLEFVGRNNPKQLAGLVEEPYAKIVLLISFDDISIRAQKKKIKQARKILHNFAYEFSITRDEHEKEALWKIRHSAATVAAHAIDGKRALPIVEDGVVPPEKLNEFIRGVYEIFKKHNQEIQLWGHAADGNLHMQPMLDLGNVNDRQKVFKITDDYYNLVLSLGGSTSGEHNDGRLRAPYLPEVYGPHVYEMFEKVKAIFDPYETMNPGVKIGVERKDLVPILKRDYKLDHLYDHMPRT